MFFGVDPMLDAAALPGFNVLPQLIGSTPSGVSFPMLLPGERRVPVPVPAVMVRHDIDCPTVTRRGTEAGLQV